MMAIGENGEILPIAGEIGCEASARQRIRERISGEAGNTLLTIGNNRRSGCFETRDGIDGGLILFGGQCVETDLARVIVFVGCLQFHRPWQ